MLRRGIGIRVLFDPPSASPPRLSTFSLRVDQCERGVLFSLPLAGLVRPKPPNERRPKDVAALKGRFLADEKTSFAVGRRNCPFVAKGFSCFLTCVPGVVGGTHFLRGRGRSRGAVRVREA